VIEKAFLLGAGLGTRLRPLTDHLPKPLVPLFHRPLVEWAMEACTAAGIREFAINTHHLPEAWRELVDRGGDWKMLAEDSGDRGRNGEVAWRADWRGHPVTFFHEPELLETGGGLRNIREWIGDDDVLVHNGDIYSTLNLTALMHAHERGNALATLAVRATGIPKHLRVEADRVTDLRGELGRGEGNQGFTGIYVLNPELLAHLPAIDKVSVIPAFLTLARVNQLGAWQADSGEWWDLGDIDSYLHAHQQLPLGPAIHPLAELEEGCEVRDSVVGPGARIQAGAVVSRAVVWPRAVLASGTVATDQVVTGW
jgi:NDP-sugar pyrophosphorylase family protein